VRTNIVIDDDLINEGLKLSNLKTKKALIQFVLQEYIQNQRKKNMIDLKGKIAFSEDYNYKKLRQSS